MFRSNIFSKSVWKHFFYHKNTEKSKKCRKLIPKGGAQGGPRMWFSEILGFLGPPGGHHGSQTSPQGSPDPSGPSFLVIFDHFLIDFLKISATCLVDFSQDLLGPGAAFVEASERICDLTSTWHPPSSTHFWARWR